MLQLALTIFIVWIFFRLFDQEKLVDGSNAVVFVLTPALLILILNIVLTAFDSPGWVFDITRLSYFIVPFFFLKFPLEYNTAKAILYAASVFVMSIVSHEATMYFFDASAN